MIRGFDDEAFQKRINDRVGVNRDGKPILRLSYAPLVQTWALGEHVPRYWTRRWKEDGVWKYEQPDRWVIEKRLEPEAYWEAHAANRYQVIDDTGDVVDLGPPPEDFYVFDSLLAVHSGYLMESGRPQCCHEAWEGETKFTLNTRKELVEVPVNARQRCWGVEYREPNESDLERISQAAEEMRAGPYFDPYAPLTPEQLAALELAANLDAQRMAEAAQKRLQEASDDFNFTHGWRLFETSAKRLAHGRYHFLGQSWKAGRNGLAVPD